MIQINKQQPEIPIVTRNHANKNGSQSFKGGREVLTAFATDPIVSTLALEVPCDIGRGANAYKRGGTMELRERASDDIISAVLWIKGVDMFNALGDKIGKHFLKIPETDFSVGEDALRSPFKNVVKEQAETNNLSVEARKKLETKLLGFKITKILLSAVLTAGFMGFALPKINQAITKKLYENKKKKNSTGDKYDILKKTDSFEEFDKKISNKEMLNRSKVTDSAASFKGIALSSAANMLENNPICKMLVSDVGLTGGRVVTARNADEGMEYLFRDSASAFCYYASVPLIYKGLESISKSSQLTSIDAVSAKNVHNNLLAQVHNAGGKIAVDEFKEKTMGTLSNSAKGLLDKIPFKNDVISLEELNKYLPEELKQKAAAMSKLQPEKAVEGAVLTKQQVGDVFKNGSLNTPEFMNNIYSDRFGKELTDYKKYIPMKKIMSFRNNIDKYTQKVIDTAKKKNNGIVDEQLLKKINQKSYAMSAVYRTIAIGISALALGVIIPKVQYAMTERKTGTKEAPGLRDYDK